MMEVMKVAEKIDNEILGACVFVLLPLARDLWGDGGGEPDFAALRSLAEDKWGKIFSTKYPYFDGCLKIFRSWELFDTINYRHAEVIEFVDTQKLQKIEPRLSIQSEFSKVQDLRGVDQAVDWLKQILNKGAKETVIENNAKDLIETGKEQPSLDADDTWEPLPLDRSSPEFEETITGIEEKIREIGADNGFSSTYPDERNNIINHAKATLESAKEGKVTKDQIIKNLVSAGKWVGDKFAGSALGALGTKLAELGLKLLGLS